MAKTTKTTRTTGRTTRSWLNLFSFIAVMLLGLSLAISILLTKVFPSTAEIAGWLRNIAIAIALIVPLFYSYFEARRQKQVWFILWIIAVVLIVVFYVWGIL